MTLSFIIEPLPNRFNFNFDVIISLLINTFSVLAPWKECNHMLMFAHITKKQDGIKV
jgi:hypothetical protein